MQIDGHHGLTYIAARFAGFNSKEAAKVAYSAQYVDDALQAHRFDILHDVLPKYGICVA
ncbi:hypothetical protein HWQ46_18440 [Shewanella sp. D64]|uniref:DUF6765 family protein n=1 Tax=unclassified Shewanella TaxID=196818 RepID=UPI0022BA25AB|nr:MULTISPECIES: DUF6765 family protein [unclassified Shewanella]MEC4727526.1 hypothetical protein [Shewanella sp. D64]MEC4738065.1 hypothetical protein [Shewanella sp. E94]WBJ96419.1 hypothetical protein HWQ47_04660 [Shewanella sp. MTB7]